MSGKPKIYKYKTMRGLVNRLRDDLRDNGNGGSDFVLLYAYNGTGKTRLSMEFKEKGKSRQGVDHDTLYFNAFTEDLFSWDNDLEGDSERFLKFNEKSEFFSGFQQLALEDKVFEYLERYTDFNFRIDYINWKVIFSRDDDDNIKISRGEENIFIWCVFLAIIQLVIDGDMAYSWVENVYIDDPISSLDDNNAIAVASDLAQLLITGKGNVKTVISSHHSLFFNVICNELKKHKHKKYFMHFDKTKSIYTLRSTDDTPFFHHIAMLSELKRAMDSDNLYTHHFNTLRIIMEKTSTFFGMNEFSDCMHGIDDEVLYARALNLLSHGKYSLYEPREMVPDTKDLFRNIFNVFLARYEFSLHELVS